MIKRCSRAVKFHDHKITVRIFNNPTVCELLDEYLVKPMDYIWIAEPIFAPLYFQLLPLINAVKYFMSDHKKYHRLVQLRLVYSKKKCLNLAC